MDFWTIQLQKKKGKIIMLFHFSPHAALLFSVPSPLLCNGLCQTVSCSPVCANSALQYKGVVKDISV